MKLPHYYLGWIAFSISVLGVIGNDAVQTLGTFIENKRKVPWGLKLLMFGSLFAVLYFLTWKFMGGQVDFNRLKTFPVPKTFTLFQILCPILLVIITRFKAPVSTTFFILSLFGGSNLASMLTKSFTGYIIAFFISFIGYYVLVQFDPEEYHTLEKKNPVEEAFWSRFQWFTTAVLWVCWISQDSSNLAIFLPRTLEFSEVLFAISIFVLALGFVFYTGGGAIQSIISEKKDIQSSKAATLLDIFYAILLLLALSYNSFPVSTTWLFLGILAGRELSLNVATAKDLPYLETFRKVGKDIFLASMGLVLSLALYYLSQHWEPKAMEIPKILTSFSF